MSDWEAEEIVLGAVLREPWTRGVRTEILRQRARPAGARSVNYAKYMDSDGWLAIRDAVRARDEGLCRICRADGRAVHHIHYRTLGFETGEELALLCEDCHDKEHERGGREPGWLGSKLKRLNPK